MSLEPPKQKLDENLSTGSFEESHLDARIEKLVRTASYQAWLRDFSVPETYNQELYSQMNLKNDWEFKFDIGYRESTLKVPIVFMCSISKPLYNIVRQMPRTDCGKLYFERSDGFSFWWLMRYLRHKSPLPDAKGMALVLQTMYHHGIAPIVCLIIDYLYCYLSLDTFPYVFNAAVETGVPKLLDLCGRMIAAWSDELLTSPCISYLGDKAILHLISHPNLSPSSEVLVFNAINNWGMRRRKKCRETLECCLKQVRFFLLTEQQFVDDVLPSGMFPFEEADIMIEMLLKRREWESGILSLISDPDTHATPRPELLMTVTFGTKLHEMTHPQVIIVYTRNNGKQQLAWFKVDKPILLRRLGSMCVQDQEGGILLIKSQSGSLFSTRWKHFFCTLEQPLALNPGCAYYLDYITETGRTDRELPSMIHKTVGGVTFDGMLFYQNLFLEFATVQTGGAASHVKLPRKGRPP